MSAVIKVVGVGGGGGNAVQRMIESGIQGVEFIVMNTDVQVLDRSPATKKVQLGINYAKGLGAGGDPASGRASAEESKADIRKALEGADMVFITACMGGGTGTGAAEVIADVAQEMDALTVAVVTKPFKFEGVRRERRAEEGIKSLLPKVDTIITIPNDKILSVVERKNNSSRGIQSRRRCASPRRPRNLRHYHNSRRNQRRLRRRPSRNEEPRSCTDGNRIRSG